jgi:hypothetical protein
VVGQGDHHRVDGLVIENPAEVPKGGHRFAPVIERSGFAIEEGLIHVA